MTLGGKLKAPEADRLSVSWPSFEEMVVGVILAAPWLRMSEPLAPFLLGWSYGSFFMFKLFIEVDVHEEAVDETDGEGDALNMAAPLEDAAWNPFTAFMFGV